MMTIELPAPFDTLPASALRRIACGRNEILFRQGDPTLGMFFMVSGEIHLVRNTEQGDQVSIHRAMAGETFAEASLFSDTYHCDAISRSSSQVTLMDRQILLDTFRHDPGFATALVRQFAGQVQAGRRRLELLAIRSAESRVLDAVRGGYLVSDIKTFSTTIGLTHEATYRALSALVRKGFLTRSGRGKYHVS